MVARQVDARDQDHADDRSRHPFAEGDLSAVQVSTLGDRRLRVDHEEDRVGEKRPEGRHDRGDVDPQHDVVERDLSEHRLRA
jgi:hypothetical protein